MLRTFLVLVLVVAFGFLVSTDIGAGEIGVAIDDVAVDFDDMSPTIVDGRTLVPVRGVFEALGFDVEWLEWIAEHQDRDPTLVQAVVLTRGYDRIVIEIGFSYFYRSLGPSLYKAISLDVPAQIIEGRTLLPIRPVLESVGYYVDWDDVTRTVVVSSVPFETSEDYGIVAVLELATFISNMEFDFLVDVMAPLAGPHVPWGMSIELRTPEDVAWVLLRFGADDWNRLLSAMNEDDLAQAMELFEALQQ